ncbi:MAG TPA: hypothetical protein PK228_06460 [Saprospiraceae bacterium]|nr:hypothetical protein [Saprospiraceae bacterium]
MFAQTRILASLFLLAFVLTSCHSAQKFVENGDYDGAIDFCIRKLRGKTKKKTEYVQGLEAAFAKAQVRDLDSADRLMADGRPENWERINAIHRTMAERQRKISPLTPLVSKDGYRAKFNFLDVATLERESRTKAAEYLYNHAKELIAKGENGDRLAARKAYDALADLQTKYYRDYRDADQLRATARDLGTSYVLFEVKNGSDKMLPHAFVDRVMMIGKHDLDTEWKAFFFEAKPGVQYDYKAVFKIRRVEISPERVHERAYVDEKEIEDGWDYVLDHRGNVKKDSLGNDIKVPHKVCIKANVLEVYQTKAARLTGVVEIYDAYRNTLLDTRELSTEILFENYASTFTGDSRALSEDSKWRIGNMPKPFPRDEDMLVQAADRLKPNLRDELRKNRAIL